MEFFSKKTQKGRAGGAESGAVEAPSGSLANPGAPTDVELACVVDCWPRLAKEVRAAILAMLQATLR